MITGLPDETSRLIEQIVGKYTQPELMSVLTDEDRLRGVAIDMYLSCTDEGFKTAVLGESPPERSPTDQ